MHSLCVEKSLKGTSVKDSAPLAGCFLTYLNSYFSAFVSRSLYLRPSARILFTYPCQALLSGGGRGNQEIRTLLPTMTRHPVLFCSWYFSLTSPQPAGPMNCGSLLLRAPSAVGRPPSARIYLTFKWHIIPWRQMESRSRLFSGFSPLFIPAQYGIKVYHAHFWLLAVIGYSIPDSLPSLPAQRNPGQFFLSSLSLVFAISWLPLNIFLLYYIQIL